jgi:uncharacterized membrane protein YdjX (TVP38/TMEM64 family)
VSEKSDAAMDRGRKGRQWWRPVALLVAVVGVLVVARMFGLDRQLLALRDWIDQQGALGYVVYILVYAGATVAAIPASPLTVIAGVLFGSVAGVIAVSIAATLGASLAFLVGRYFARGATERSLSNNRRFKRLYDLTESHGAIIVAITRLVPLFPFNLLNYGFGLTRVRFGTYVFWSWLCMLPGTILYVVGADAVSRAFARGEIPWVLVGVFVAALAALILLVRLARSKLQSGEQETKDIGNSESRGEGHD